MNSFLRLLGLESSQVHSIIETQWHAAEPLSDGLLASLVFLGLALAGMNFLPQIRMRLRVRLYTFLLRLCMVALLVAVVQKTEAHFALQLHQIQRWLVMVDDSASMATKDAGKDSRFWAAINDLGEIQKRVEGKVELDVRTLSGQPIGQSTGSGPTQIHEAIVRNVLSRGDLHRLVLLTDGRDLEGRDFTLTGQDLKARGISVSIGLYGGEVPPRDFYIHAEPEQAVIRLGEDLVVRGSINSPNPQSAYEVQLKENGKVVKTLTVPAEQSRWFLVNHKPAKAGKFNYTLKLAAMDSLPDNNRYSFTARVLEEKIKVLMIEGFPRFEFKLLKAALETDPMVHLVTISHLPNGGVYVQGQPLHDNPAQGLITSQSELFKYDVVILRDVPRILFRAGGDTTETRLRLIVDFVQKRGGGLIVLGGQDVYRAGRYENSALAEILPFDLSAQFSKQAQFQGKFFVNVPGAAFSHPMLRFFPDPEQNRERWNSLRELDGSNNVGRFRPLATPLLTRFVKLKNVRGEMEEKEIPLMAFHSVGDGKVLAAAVDTFWRWQLQLEFDEPPLQKLLANAVRYLAPDPQSRAGSPSVALTDASPQVGQEAVLSTVLKDKNYDPIEKADLKVEVKRPDGKTDHLYPRDLPEQPGYYEYRVSLDAPGHYEVTAISGKQRTTTNFIAGVSGGEYTNLSANRSGMKVLTDAAGGELINSVNDWLNGIDLNPSSREAKRELQVWNSPAVVLLLLLLVCWDCYLRKRQGLP